MSPIDDPFKRSFEPKCEEGDIIVFPSYLDHWVRPNSNNETIAGNVVFSKIIYKQ